jgi:hypothetical protein
LLPPDSQIALCSIGYSLAAAAWEIAAQLAEKNVLTARVFGVDTEALAFAICAAVLDHLDETKGHVDPDRLLGAINDVMAVPFSERHDRTP